MLQHVGVVIQLNLSECCTPANSNFTILVAHVADDKYAVRSNIDGKVSVKVGDNTELCILHLDGSANKRLTVLIHNLATNLDGL